MAVFGPYHGVVDLVHDGDSIYCKLDLGFSLTMYARVRVLGINAPELSTESGKASRDFARTLLPAGTPVTVTSMRWDKFAGRVDGTIVLADGVSFGQKMLDAGQAVVYTGGPR